MTKRVLVVGGAGAFGSLLVRGLAATTDYEIILGGRDAARADALAKEIRADWPGRSIAVTPIDRRTITPETLRKLGIFAVADAAGPFQGADLSLAESAVEAGIHYVDLADARDFVAAFPRLDAMAKERHVTALTGASSTPALTHAVLDRLTRDWRAIDSVEIAISPGNRAPRGLSVVAAILSYAGRPVRVFLDGEWQTRPGWGMLTAHVRRAGWPLAVALRDARPRPRSGALQRPPRSDLSGRSRAADPAPRPVGGEHAGARAAHQIAPAFRRAFPWRRRPPLRLRHGPWRHARGSERHGK